jgi:alcohol dehydrogenase (cytochrome c)
MTSSHFKSWGRVVSILLLIAWAAGAVAGSMGPTQAELDHAAKSTETWLMTNKSYDGQRYVELDQINAENVSRLRVLCTFDSGVKAPAQSSPVMYAGRMYFTAGQTTVAIDANSCRELWRYEWRSKGKFLSVVNRGLGMKDGRLVRGTADGYLIALAMADGKLLWERQITSFEESHYLSMPATIVEDTVIYGTAGADWGSQGWIGGFSLKDGSEKWRYAVLPPPNGAGSETWGSSAAIAHGGGRFWTPVSVDRVVRLRFGVLRGRRADRQTDSAGASVSEDLIRICMLGHL